MSVAVPFGSSSLSRGPRLLVLAALLWAAMVPMAGARAVDGTPVEHLVVSEVVTGGTSASDEIIEIHNPAPAALPLEGLELIYVSASGATITRRAAWALGAPVVQPGGHVLVANEAGIFASVADATYAAGMAATGGSVALRVQGASTAIDAVGWGTAAGTWREGINAVAPAAGASIERLPGGLLGSTQDTDDNVADFVERPMPEPQNLGSPPTPATGDPPPTPTPTPVPTSTPTITPAISPTVEPTVSPSPSATPAPISVAAARAAPDDAVVTVEGTALTASNFHDGGGFLADASGGIAVLLDEGSFARGDLLRVMGTVDDRFSQRTLRSGGTDVVTLGSGVAPAALTLSTGAVNESIEGSLVRITGFVAGSPTTLTAGIAFDIDDGTGSARVIVSTESAIDLAAWTTGARVDIIGVAGQRDSTGTGAEGYRVMPRDANDVVEVGGPTVSPAPSSSASATPEPTATPGDPEGVVSISNARAAPKNARLRVRGVVTLAPGTVDPATAAIQDATGAIVLRLGDDVGALDLGERIEVAGTRSTKGGMETLRVTEVPLQLGMAPEPAPRAIHTGEADESLEALLVVARGALVASARRASSGTVSFEIDDGSGPLRVSLDSSLEADDASLTAGTWVEVRGILGQETTGAQPMRGYRIWPRTVTDVRVVAAATDPRPESADEAGTPAGSLVEVGGGVGGADLSGPRVGATLVAGPWQELAVGGILWDGARLVAIDPRSSGMVTAITALRPVPVALELGGLRTVGSERLAGLPLVALGIAPGDVVPGEGSPVPPLSTLSGAERNPLWVSLVGRLVDGGRSLVVAGRSVPIEARCDEASDPATGIVGVTGIAAGDPVRLIAPCGGIRAAPAVSRSGATRSAAAPAPGEALTATQALSARADDDPRRTVVAGLFGVGALMLAAAVLARRRLEPDPTDAAAEGMSVEAPHEAEAPAVPHLTLVRVPRERGP